MLKLMYCYLTTETGDFIPQYNLSHYFAHLYELKYKNFYVVPQIKYPRAPSKATSVSSLHIAIGFICSPPTSCNWSFH